MKTSKIAAAAILVLLLATLVHAAAVEGLLAKYNRLGAGNFNAKAGEEMWNKPFKDPVQGARSCATCHQSDLRINGKQVNTGKTIEPMAPSVNSKRLTDAKFIEKWFNRNCKWTMGRECTPQEKGNFLMFIKGK
ncbi:MAG: DUF1924 domain-containing protein [Nitrospirae bacterium]|nr:DUF1924 domain-containing protein [Nitrospirota bacterium]